MKNHQTGGKRKVVFYGRISTEHEEQTYALCNQMQWYSQEKFYKELMNILTTKKERALFTAKDQYYSALCLEETDRYLYGSDDEFLKFKEEVSSVIEPARQRNYNSMHERHLAIIDSAMSTIPSNVALDYDLHIVTNKDKAGICHIMVNEGNLSWEKEDE